MKKLFFVVMLGSLVGSASAASFAEVAEFSKANCPFSAPSGERAECGYLTVPESRKQNNQRDIKLFVTIVKSYSHTPKTDPIVVLDGGKASSTQLSNPQYWSKYAPFRQDRDLIFVDARGRGLSQPVLTCSQLENKDTTSEQDYLIRLKNCKDKFVADKIDLSAFNTKENALDIIALMRVLQYKKWNVLASSYDTRTALVVLGLKPQHLRSVVLNSAMPLTKTNSEAQEVNDKRVFKQFFYDCGVNSKCSKSFPNLKDVYAQLVLSLPNNKQEDGFSSDLVKSELSKSLSDQESLYYLPQKIFDLAQANAKGKLNMERFKQIIQPSVTTDNVAALSLSCFDFGKSLPDGFLSKQCDIWGKGSELDVFAAAKFQAVPVMVLTGEYDTQLPPQWARDVAKQLPNAKLFQFKGVGHDVIGSLSCAMYMTAAFFDRPDHQPEDACMTALKPPSFFVPEQEQVRTATLSLLQSILQNAFHL